MQNKLFRRMQKLIQIAGYSKKYYRNNTILDGIFNKYNSKNTISLDLGSGPIPKNPFNSEMLKGVDFRENKENNVMYADLSLGKLPFKDNEFDFISSYDVFEHIQRVGYFEGKTIFPFIALMNEVFRILKPNGILFSIQPVYPSKLAFQDPTHVNIMSEDTMDFYFCEKSWARIYGYNGSFKMLEDGWIGDKYFSFLQKNSDITIDDLNFKQQ
jgi:SAM-dependent methyltransferase